MLKQTKLVSQEHSTVPIERKSSRIQNIAKRKLENNSEPVETESVPVIKKTKLKKDGHLGRRNYFGAFTNEGEKAPKKTTIPPKDAKVLPTKREVKVTTSQHQKKGKTSITNESDASKIVGKTKSSKKLHQNNDDEVVFIDFEIETKPKVNKNSKDVNCNAKNNCVKETVSVWTVPTPSIWNEDNFLYYNKLLPNHVQCLPSVEIVRERDMSFNYIDNLTYEPVISKTYSPLTKISNFDKCSLESVERNAKSVTITTKNKNNVSNILWNVLYKPSKASEVIGNNLNIEFLASWLLEWKNKQRSATKDNESSCSSYAWSDIDDEMIRCVLITGPTGFGKTSLVYALAQEYKFKVFEVNASSVRGSKQIISQLQEATQSHHVEGLASNALTRFLIKHEVKEKKDVENPKKSQEKEEVVVKKPRGRPKKIDDAKSKGIAAYFKKQQPNEEKEPEIIVPEVKDHVEKTKLNSIRNWLKSVDKKPVQDEKVKVFKNSQQNEMKKSKVSKVLEPSEEQNEMKKSKISSKDIEPSEEENELKQSKISKVLRPAEEQNELKQSKISSKVLRPAEEQNELKQSKISRKDIEPSEERNELKTSKISSKVLESSEEQKELKQSKISSKDIEQSEKPTSIEVSDPIETEETPVGENQEGLKFSSSSIILFDDVDLVFDEDEGFWSSVNNFIKTTKKPVILTASRSLDFVMGCINSNFETLNLDITANQCAKFLRKIVEDLKLNYGKEDLKLMTRYCKKDIRKTLIQTQFWSDSNNVTTENGVNFNSPVVKYCLDKDLRKGVLDFLISSDYDDCCQCLQHFKSEGYYPLHANLENWLPLPKKDFGNITIVENTTKSEKNALDFSWISEEGDGNEVKTEDIKKDFKKEPLVRALLDQFSSFFDNYSDLDQGFCANQEVYTDYKSYKDEQSSNKLSMEMSSWFELAACQKAKNDLTAALVIGDQDEALTDSVHLNETETEFRLTNYGSFDPYILNAVNLISSTVIPVQHVNNNFEKIEYISALKIINNTENFRHESQTTRTRRFHHYFDANSLTVDDSALKFLSKMLK